MSSRVLTGDRLALVRPYTLAEIIFEMEHSPGNDAMEGIEVAEESEVCRVNEERIAEIENEAYSRGFETGQKAGREAGLEKGYKEAASIIAVASRMADELKKLRREIFEKSEEEIFKLSLAVAKKVINTEVTLNRDVVLSIVKAAIKELTARDNIKVRLNPDDAEHILDEKKELLTAADGIKELAIEEDTSVPKGGCIVDAGLAEVDARLEQQIEEITKGLYKGIGK